MFRRSSNLQASTFDGNNSTSGTDLQQHNAAATQQQAQADTSTASTIAAIRRQQQSRRRSGDPAAANPLQDASAQDGKPSLPGSGRSRVQQPVPLSGDAPFAIGSNRQQLQPLMLASLQPALPKQQNEGAPRSIPQLFSVFHNPLSTSGQASSGQASDTQKPNSNNMQQAPAGSAPSLQAVTEIEAAQQHESVEAGQLALGAGATPSAAVAPSSTESSTNAHGHNNANEAGGQYAAAAADASASDSKKAAAGRLSLPIGHQPDLQPPAAALHKAYRFEVHAAAADPDGLIDYDGHDQMGYSADGQQQQLKQQLGNGPAAATQQYVYNQDTGQLCRVGEGADATRVGRHYVEDCHTGEFFQLVHQPGGGWLAWIRRRPSLGAHGWFQRGQGGLQSEPSILRSLSEFTDTMGSGMAALGLFAQGMVGGLALLCLFMTYLQYATAGREGFLTFYSPQAQMVNRAFFTLISISLVAAAARHAYDKVGHFSPRHLRLGVVDCLVMLLYLLAYTCNLLATPLDDQLAFEARRDAAFAQLPLPAAFVARLSMWHALNLIRVIACGLAWVLVCYRSNPFVMMKVFEARNEEATEQHQGQQAVGAGLGGLGAAAAAATTTIGIAADRGGMLGNGGEAGVGVGSCTLSPGYNAGHHHQQQQWTVVNRFMSGSDAQLPGGSHAGGAVGSSSADGNSGWPAVSDERRLLAAHYESSSGCVNSNGQRRQATVAFVA